MIDKETKIRGADVKGQNLEMDRQGDSHSSLMKFNKQSLSANYMPGTVPAAADPARNDPRIP